MVYSELSIALAFMTYIGELYVYELHMGVEKSSTTLLMDARVLHYTYGRGSILFKGAIRILILMNIYERKCLYVYALSLVF